MSAQIELRVFEVSGMLSDAHLRAKGGNAPDLRAVQQGILEIGRQFPESGQVLGVVSGLFDYARFLRFDENAQRTFISEMKGSPNILLRRLGEGKARTMQYQAIPMDLQVTTLDGKNIDVADWRGKVVLIDFWALACSSCIDAMPHIRSLYERFRSSGLEVLGMCFDPPEDRPKVERLLDKLDVRWPQSLQGVSSGDNPAWDRWGFTALGTLLVLNKEGRLVWADFRHEELEPVIREQLGHEAVR